MIFKDTAPKVQLIIGIFGLVFWSPRCIWAAFALSTQTRDAFIQVRAIVSQWFLAPVSRLAILKKIVLNPGIWHRSPKIYQSLIKLSSFSLIRLNSIRLPPKFGMDL